MKDYFETLGELKKAGVKGLYGEIYDYYDLPLEKEFEQFYCFCQEYVDRKDLGFNIRPALVYYNTNVNLNAVAWLKDGIYLIEIFKGTMFHLHEFYTGKSARFEQDQLRDYSNLLAMDGISGGVFLFQYTTLYFLYHEVGHLIQRSNGSADQLEFMDHECKGESVAFQHVKEHDADWFGANQIAFHIKAFVQKITPVANLKNSDLLKDIASLSLAGIYMYFINRSNASMDLYFEEKCHPHPFVRLCYITKYLLDALSENLPFSFDQQLVLTDAIKISELLMEEPNKNPVQEQSLKLLQSVQEIEEYIKKIRHNSEAYSFTTISVLR